MSRKIEVLIPKEDISKKLDELAKEIDKEYAGTSIHIIGVLKGSIFFVCELAKRITIPVTLDFMSVSSYGDGTVSTRAVKLIKDLDEPLEGRDVILLEDIVDSGNTLSYLRKVLEARNPHSFKVMTLLDKPDRREVDVKVDHSCFIIPDEFVVGYGLDAAQQYRNLPYIGVIKD